MNNIGVDRVSNNNAFTSTPNNTSNNTSCKEMFYIVCSVLLSCYVVGIGIGECYVGGVAADLVINYYDHSVEINNTSIRIAIDSLPRNIYANTKTSASIYILFGSLAVIAVVAIYGMACCKMDSSIIHLSVLASFLAFVVPFCYSAFLTWKVNSLSAADKATWDSVDVRFVENMQRSQNILIATVVPGSIELVILCVAALCMR